MDPRQLWGRTVVPFVLDSSYFSFQVKDNAGCYVLARQRTTDPEPQPVPGGGEQWYLKYPIQVGTSWTNQDEFVLLYRTLVETAEKSWNTQMNVQIMNTDETVTVPAGTFTHCVRVRGLGQRTIQAFPDDLVLRRLVHLSMEETNWFALGVGTIKTLRIEKGDDTRLLTAQLGLELVSFTK